MKDFKKTVGPSRKPYGARPSFAPGRGARTFGPRSEGPTEMHQATCNECHKKCEVPFRPNGKKPVYCRDCFKGKEEEQPAYGRAPSRMGTSSDSSGLSREISMLGTKIDRLIEAIEAQTRSLSKSR